jgi:hypothetical protein
VEHQISKHAALEPSQRHAALERYLSLATRGLWGHKKLEVRRELDGNIREMALEFQIAGINEHDSIQRALEEFGAPQKVSVGMSKVYLIPTMIRNVVLALTISSLTVSVFNVSNAQVTGTTRQPFPKCLNSDVKTVQIGNTTLECDSYQFWISTISLRQVLEPLGVKFEINQFPREAHQKISFRFPGATSSLIFNQDISSAFVSPSGEPASVDLDPNYIDTSDFFNQLRTTGLSVTVDGWDNPTITVGQTRFSLGTTKLQVTGDRIYPEFLPKLLPNFWPEQKPDDKLLYISGEGMLGNPGSVVNNPHQIKLNKTAKTAYVVVTREPGPITVQQWDGEKYPEKTYSEFRLTRILTNDATETLKFASNAKTLEFINDPKLLKTVTRNGAGQAVLLKFTGHLEVGSTAFEVVTAKQLSITKK